VLDTVSRYSTYYRHGGSQVKDHGHQMCPELWQFLQKDRTMVEWKWQRHRKANNKGLLPQKLFRKLGPCP